MAKNIQAIRGMNDILPEENVVFLAVEDILRRISSNYGYKEIRLPLVEFTELFSRTIGEATDIVEKEMYTFLDRNGDSLTLRPEGTASCVRAGIEHGLLFNQIQRLFYAGPMFRHERPQKGRYRQFYQFGIEAFGLAGPDIDVEILLLAKRFWEELGILHKVELQINSLGNAQTRALYREKLINYFQNNFALLDEDSTRRLSTNPLRILDSKNPALKDLIENAPKITDCFDTESAAHFTNLCKLLDGVGLTYKINPCLVRGLDYYCLTVFEWVTSELGSQGAICAGGHYDGLVASLGGKATPAIGFAIGLERLVSLAAASMPGANTEPHLYFVLLGDSAVAEGMRLAEKIRDVFPTIKLVVNCGNGNLGVQLKRADKSGAKIALILGEEEIKVNEVTLKYLREEREQQRIKIDDLIGELQCTCQIKSRNNY